MGLVDPFDQQNLLVVVDLLKLDFDDLAAAGGHMLADIGGFDGQLAMAAIDEHSQLHAAWPSVIEKSVESCPDGAALVEHIVAQHHVATLDVDADGAGCDYRANIRGCQVVAVELNIEYPGIDRALFYAADQLPQPLCQRNTAALDADQGQVFTAIALLHNLMEIGRASCRERE